MTSGTGREAIRDWRIVVSFAAAYAACAAAGWALSVRSLDFPTFWPASGLYLGALLMTGRKRWPWLIAGGLVADVACGLVAGRPWPAAGFAVANAIEAVAGAVVLRAWRGQPMGLKSLRDVVALAVVGVASAGLGGLVGGLVASSTSAVPFRQAWELWWVTDVLGVLLIAPVTIGLLGPPEDRLFGSLRGVRGWELLGILTMSALTTELIFGSTTPPQLSTSSLFLFLIWAAIRFGVGGVWAVMLLLAPIAIWHTVQGRGPYMIRSDPVERSRMLQMFLGIGAMMGYALAAVMRERLTAEARLREMNASLEDRVARRTADLAAATEDLERWRNRHEAAILASGHILYDTDERTGRVHHAGDSERILGFSSSELSGEPSRWFSRIAATDRDRYARELDAARRDRRPFRLEYRMVDRHGGEVVVQDDGFPLHDESGRLISRVGFVKDVTDQRRVEAELMAADRRKDEFLATLAHELRNPLAPLGNALQLQRIADGRPELHEQARGIMERQLRHLVRLVDDLLDVSRISRGKLELKRERLDLREAVRTAIETTGPLLESRSHSLEVRLPGEPIWLDADPTRLAQVVANLLNNSAKYTDHGGRIEVEAGRVGATATLRVFDNGIGIAPEVLPRIFDMFTQERGSLDRSQGGLGIGLTLVRRLVELHGGEVEARSEGTGRGSEFVVRLPSSTGAEASDGHDRGEGRVASSAARRLRLLVVDDNRDSATTLGRLLEVMGHEVRVSFDGEEALREADSRPPDLAILDLGMPGMSGFDVARAIRARGWGRGVTLVALTGWGQEDDRRRSSEAGFDHHLVKPVQSSSLAEILEEAWASGGRDASPA